MFTIRMYTPIKLALSFVLLLSSLQFAYAQGYAKLSIKKVKYDMGIIYTDSACRMFDIPFVNKGKEPLKIKETRTDCTCTTVKYPRNKIPANGVDTLRVTIEMTGFFPGDYEKKVGVYSNSKKSPLMIYFKGKIVRKE